MPPTLDNPKTSRKPAAPRRTSRGKPSRLAGLLKFDRQILVGRSGECLLIGLDEVGRGSLIGPVVGGAVCLPATLTREQRKLLHWLDDSKKLTAGVRAELSEAIHAFCRVGIGLAEKDEVDTLNVHYASLMALYRAFCALCQTSDLCPRTGDLFLIMDGKAVIPDYRPDVQRAVIKGDGQSAAIAAASVVAKHYRDTLVQGLARDYPGYGWEDNMGYGTPAHLQGIRELGVTPHHRRNFRKVHEQLLLPFG